MSLYQISFKNILRVQFEKELATFMKKIGTTAVLIYFQILFLSSLILTEYLLNT